RPRQRTNYSACTLAILLLTAFAFAAWLGSFYVFWQPERPDSYGLLKKRHRIDPPRRFDLTAAPAADFLSPNQLHDRYAPTGDAFALRNLHCHARPRDLYAGAPTGLEPSCALAPV